MTKMMTVLSVLALALVFSANSAEAKGHKMTPKKAAKICKKENKGADQAVIDQCVTDKLAK